MKKRRPFRWWRPKYVVAIATVTLFTIGFFLCPKISKNKPITLMPFAKDVANQISLRRTMKNQRLKDAYPCLRPNPGPGVEDLFCQKRPDFIPNVKNPCWYDNTAGVRCLPYFHILGCAKCATTDLFHRLSIHPHFVENNGVFRKETLWWSWGRYGLYGKRRLPIRHFEEYLDHFDAIASIVDSSLKNGTTEVTFAITGDGSPPDFWDFRGWPKLPQNHGLKEPEVLTPHLMNHLYPDPKFILVFRNPIDRLYSDYFFLHQGNSSEDFHNHVLESLDVLAKCRTQFSLRRCYFSSSIHRRLPTRIHYGCYSVHLKEWLEVFPRRHFLIMKTEEYSKNISKHLEMTMSFLGMAPMQKELMDIAVTKGPTRITESKRRAGPMLKKTRKILRRFYSPFNKELASILKDNKFLWS